MKVLLRFAVECSLVVDAVSVAAAETDAERIPFEDWMQDYGPIDGTDITAEFEKQSQSTPAGDPS